MLLQQVVDSLVEEVVAVVAMIGRPYSGVAMKEKRIMILVKIILVIFVVEDDASW
jgi:hypothetical protein